MAQHIYCLLFPFLRLLSFHHPFTCTTTVHLFPCFILFPCSSSLFMLVFLNFKIHSSCPFCLSKSYSLFKLIHNPLSFNSPYLWHLFQNLRWKTEFTSTLLLHCLLSFLPSPYFVMLGINAAGKDIVRRTSQVFKSREESLLNNYT